jgi:hypothetical protein
MWIVAHFGDVVDIASKVVAAASAVAALTPTPKDDTVLAGLRKVVDFVGFNFGFAKNK